MRFRPWVLVSLQGAAAVCAWVLVAPLYALRRLGAGGARAARVALLCALRSLGAGDAGCRCCVHLGAWALVLLQGAAAVCLGAWALVPLLRALVTKRERRSRGSLNAMIPMLSGVYAGVISVILYGFTGSD